MYKIVSHKLCSHESVAVVFGQMCIPLAGKGRLTGALRNFYGKCKLTPERHRKKETRSFRSMSVCIWLPGTEDLIFTAWFYDLLLHFLALLFFRLVSYRGEGSFGLVERKWQTPKWDTLEKFEGHEKPCDMDYTRGESSSFGRTAKMTVW